MRVLILADDLSGAADCAAPFAQRGLRTVVTLGVRHDLDDADVVAIDADTRRLSASAAAAQIAELVREYAPADGALFFKKIDSQLRGHIGVEIAAALRELRNFRPAARAIVAPAFPKQCRVTRGKQQYVNGVRLDIDLGRLLAEAGVHGAQICDAESDADLAAIANTAPRDALWVGSAGLARHIDTGPWRPRGRGDKKAAIPSTGLALFVAGSGSAVTREQADLLVADGVREIEFDPSSLDPSPFTLTADTLVRLPRKVSMEAHAARFALAYYVAPQIDRAAALVLTGGETARAVLETIGVTGLRVRGEAEPGVAVSTAAGAWTGYVITKSGGFGDARTLVRCRALLKTPTLK